MYVVAVLVIVFLADVLPSLSYRTLEHLANRCRYKHPNARPVQRGYV